MFCHNCGKEVSEGAVFCSQCGARQNTGNTVEAEKNAAGIQAGNAVPGSMQEGSAAIGSAQNAVPGSAQGGNAAAGSVQNAEPGSMQEGSVVPGSAQGGNAAAGSAQNAVPGSIQEGNAAIGSAQPGKKKKGKGGIIALVIVVVLLIGAGAGAALYFTGDAYMSRKNMKLAEECFDAEEYEEALAYYEEALKLDPGLTEAYLKSADIRVMEGEYEEAIGILEKGLKKTREDEDAQEEIEGKIEEIGHLENEAATAKLQEYLKNELEPQYGYADLNARSQFFDWNVSFEENKNWTGAAGMAKAEIRDLDGDGRDEMLVLVLKEEEISLSIYEVENNVPVKKAEHSEERIWDMFGYEVLYSMVDGGGVPYLFVKEELSGILSDGYQANIKLYRYDGTTFYMPLGILQTGGGSSDFEFKAYEYDAFGNLLNEETVYDEVYDHEVNYDSAYCRERIVDLFGKYGLALDSGAAANPEQDLFADLQAARGYQELLFLNMWGVYLDEGAEYHFNDWDSPILVYESFLRGEKTVRTRAGAWFSDQEQMDLTIQDMLAKVEKVYLEYSEKDTITRIEYAYLDCGGDGVEELAVRFVGLDIYSPDDDSDLTAIIACRDGELELIYSRESWARSGTAIYSYGCIYTGGSSGAGDYCEELEYINAEHEVQSICQIEILGGWWVSFVSEEAYQEAFDAETADPQMQISIYTINGSEYHVAEIYDESSQECQNYIALCQAEGKVFVQEEEIEAMLLQRMKELGIKDEWKLDTELYWRWL